MGKLGFWKSDWFVAVLIALVVLIASGSNLLQGLERIAYDMGVRATGHAPSDKVAVITIDHQSITNIGRWSWSRDIHAGMIELLTQARAKVVGTRVFYLEPQIDPGLVYINKLIEAFQWVPATARQQLGQIEVLLGEAEQNLNTDRKLGAAIAGAGTVVLPMLFNLGELLGNPDRPLPKFVLKNNFTGVEDNVGTGAAGRYPLSTVSVLVPMESFGAGASAVEHLNAAPARNGSIRIEPLVLRYCGNFYPSLALMIAARGLNLLPKDVKVQSGEGVGTTQVTPISAVMAPVLTLAHSVSSIPAADFYVQPPWATWVSLGVFVLVAVYLALLLPRLSATLAAAITAVLLASLIGVHFGLMTTQFLWTPLMNAVVLLLVSQLALTTKRFLVAERGKIRSDLEPAESNRMLGLAFRGQVRLDMAFDKFRKCLLDDGLLSDLYILHQDFERKRKFNKAQSVDEYIGGHNAKFRDLGQKRLRAKQLSETVILGGGGRTNASTMILDNGQLEKELRKGAMGVAYLGRDPKIGRVVVIKAMALSQEFEPDETEDVKQRFFREAETARRLGHPNIVTIFDAAESHDFAYVALEFLKGKDLAPYSKPGNPHPVAKMLSIVARVADALAYAPAQDVVHRNIKPVNITYDPESDSVKVTDFGVARISDTSKTQTGMALGTPSFMSPEQLAGQKTDGQSDLFSWGVTIFQLASGDLPFQGETKTQPMSKIADQSPTHVLSPNPSVPDWLVAIIGRALAKDKAERWKNGGEMAAVLRVCTAGCSLSLDVSL